VKQGPAAKVHPLNAPIRKLPSRSSKKNGSKRYDVGEKEVLAPTSDGCRRLEGGQKVEPMVKKEKFPGTKNMEKKKRENPEKKENSTE